MRAIDQTFKVGENGLTEDDLKRIIDETPPIYRYENRDGDFIRIAPQFWNPTQALST